MISLKHRFWSQSRKLKRIPKTAWLLFSLSVTAGTIGAAISHPAQPIFLIGGEYDAGTVRRGDEVQSELSFVNLSTSQIATTVVPTCECTATSEGQINLRPFTITHIFIHIRTKILPSGRIDKRALVYFDTPYTHWRETVNVRFYVAPDPIQRPKI